MVLAIVSEFQSGFIVRMWSHGPIISISPWFSSDGAEAFYQKTSAWFLRSALDAFDDYLR